MAGVGVIQWGRERARAGPWRGDARVAYLAPHPEGPPPSSAFLRRCIEALSADGYQAVVTGALSPAEQHPFRSVGFDEHERLHLLALDLDELPAVAPYPDAAGGVEVRRARRGDRPRVLEVDAAAFQPFWRLDDSGLDEAIGATPVSRFRVAAIGGAVTGYAVSGRAGAHGYLQRLAVDPAQHRRGIGSALVLDALRWMRRRGSVRAVVNTQLDNGAALNLYRRLGFRLQPSGLAVLRRDLSG